MSANTMICDRDSGNVYYDIDLNSNCDGGSLCRDCMCIFLMEHETCQGCSVTKDVCVYF